MMEGSILKALYLREDFSQKASEAMGYLINQKEVVAWLAVLAGIWGALTKKILKLVYIQYWSA